VRYDLHLHSHYSDGTLTPAELVARAAAAGVDVMALTDHDCTDGMTEASAAAAAAGLRLVAGVEISVSWQQMTIHVIGLGVRTDDETLRNGLARLVAQRRERAQAIADKLAKRNIHRAFEAVSALAGGAIISRTHFAQFLVDAGIVPTKEQAFKQYLLRGGAAYVPVEWATLEEAVGWIRGAGGQAVIAHPARYKLTAGKLRKLLGEFRDCGGVAIEVVCGGQSPQINGNMAAFANEFGLLASVGSDFHGPGQHWLEPGRLPRLPEIATPVWRDWAV
jgi:3',5'-nucleoside bisphosphate phosphatase